MIKRTIEISRDKTHLSVRHRQLVIRREEQTLATIPCEDLGVVVVDQQQSTYTHAALSTLMEHDAVVVICGRDHTPVGVLLPLSDHNQVVWRVQEQVATARPIQKQLWKQLVQAKILAQARNLSQDSPSRRKMEQLARDVKSGDTSNHEAQAARIYWGAWLSEADTHLPVRQSMAARIPEQPQNGDRNHHANDSPRPDTIDSQKAERFLRDPDTPGLNTLLNYGYSIVRAAVARALVSAGLHPALGLHHSHRGNPFCLADDVMEPLRPLVDARARQLFWAGQTDLDQATKAELLEVLTEEVRLGRETGPLMVCLQRCVMSLVKCYQGTAKRMLIPVAQSERDCDSDGVTPSEKQSMLPFENHLDDLETL